MNDDMQGGYFRRLARKVLGLIPLVLHKVRRPCIDKKLGFVGWSDSKIEQRELSFCITYRNRFDQITKTLPINLEHNRADSNFIEFVIVQFGGEEDLLPWLKKHCAEDLASGYLKFFNSAKIASWHACIAKNTSHNLASGKVLTNLDADNFTGERGGRVVIETLTSQNKPSLLWQWAGERQDGTAGRISMTGALFHAIGGYDEGLGPCQQQDIDLINRLRSQGVAVVEIIDKKYAHAILHEHGLGVSANKEELARLIKDNRKKSLLNMLNGRVIANQGKITGVAAKRFIYPSFE